MKKLFFLPLFLAAGFTQAQITLSQSDFASAGDTVFMAIDATVSTANPGTAGASAQTWDFTSFSLENFDTLLFVSPAMAPGGGDFPTANVALLTGETATFFNKSASSVEVLGNGGGFGGFAFSAAYNPTFDLLTFPTQVGTTISAAYAFDVTEFVGVDTTVSVPLVGNVVIQLDSIRFKRDATVDIEFDAHGTVQLDLGNYPALRSRNVQVNNDTVFAFMGAPVNLGIIGINLVAGWNVITNDIAASISLIAPGIFLGNTTGITTVKSYDWYANNVGYRLVSLELDETTEAPVRASYLSDPIFLSVGTTELLPNAFVYPNPANSVINLNGVPQNTQGTLQLIDMTGKTVMSSSFNGENQFSVAGLAEGTYFLRLVNTEGKLVFTDKVQVIK